jgi:hypothetical protein
MAGASLHLTSVAMASRWLTGASGLGVPPSGFAFFPELPQPKVPATTSTTNPSSSDWRAAVPGGRRIMNPP